VRVRVRVRVRACACVCVRACVHVRERTRHRFAGDREAEVHPWHCQLNRWTVASGNHLRVFYFVAFCCERVIECMYMWVFTIVSERERVSQRE
jgi:hypothetical protein